MNKFGKKFTAIVLGLVTVFTCTPKIDVFADAQRIITLGEDLSEDQKDLVLAFMGVSEEDLDNSIDVVTVNNEEEHEMLDGIVPDSVIGSKTFSCAYIEPTLSGGINIKTANLTYVTNTSLYNALQTAGVENCNLLVTAPFEVSGTGALTGVFKAFELSGVELDEDKQEVATEELLLNAQLEDSYGEDSANMVSDIKEEIVSSADTMTEDDLEVVINNTATNYNINLSESDIQSLIMLMGKLQDLDYDKDAFSAKITDIVDNVEDKADDAKSIWDKIVDFFESIIDFFKGLFGLNKDEFSKTEKDSSIFDNVDTTIFNYDNEPETTLSDATTPSDAVK